MTRDLDHYAVTTTAGEQFTGEESVLLAFLVLKRFGYEQTAAAAAWRRLLQNSCEDEQFMVLTRLAGIKEDE